MSNYFPIVLLSHLLFFFPTGSSGQSDSLASRVLDLHLEKFQWMVDRDTARLATLLASDAVYVHSNGWHEAREEVLANIGSGRLRYHRVEVSDATVRAYGPVFLVNGRARFDVALEDQAWLLLLDYTEAYFREESGTIRLVSRHACRVPEP
jgi:hypothetical protein